MNRSTRMWLPEGVGKQMPGSWEITEVRSRRVLVATIAPPDLKFSWGWATRLRELELPAGSDILKVANLPYGPARNVALQNAILGGYGYLMFIDADTIVPANTVTRLMETGRDFIGALYHQRFPPYAPAVFLKQFRQVKTPDGKDVVVMDKVGLPEFNYGDILPVDFLPTGATLISRRCLEAVRAVSGKPFEWTVDIDTPGGLSEDYNFALKAQSIGFQPYLHTGISCKHEMMMVSTVKGAEAIP